MSTVVESKNELGIIMEDDDADNGEDNNNNDHLPNNESPQQQQPLNASLKQNLGTDHPISDPPQQNNAQCKHHHPSSLTKNRQLYNQENKEIIQTLLANKKITGM